MPPITRDSSLAPTLADIPIRPRRKLRDGTSASSRSSSRSSRPATKRACLGGRDVSPISAGTSASASTSYSTRGRTRNGRYLTRNARARDVGSREEDGEEYDDGADLGPFGAISDEGGDDEYVPPVSGSKKGNGRSLRSDTTRPNTSGVGSSGENVGPASPSVRRPLKRPRPPPRSAAPLSSLSPQPEPAPTTSDDPILSSLGSSGRSLIEILDNENPYAPSSPSSRRRPPEPAETPPPAPPRQNESTSSTASTSSYSSSSARPLAVEMSSSESIQEIDEMGAPRRYTRAEKGKGRAEVVQVDESPVLGVGKRKLSDMDDGTDRARRMNGVEPMGGDTASREEEGDEEEGEGLEEFSCPVCFCNLTRPVMTLCGHVFCADCLHSSLLAAIGRNPNPFPTTYTGPGPAPRARANPPLPALPGGGGNRPRGTPAQINSRSRSDPAHNPPISSMELQPTEWSSFTLLEKVRETRIKRLKEVEKEAERQFEEMEMPKENWEAAKSGMGIQEVGAEMEVGRVVEEVLRGLWRVPGGHVIEGECPVCRNAIPGGMGPIGSGIGSIIALTPWLEI